MDEFCNFLKTNKNKNSKTRKIYRCSNTVEFIKWDNKGSYAPSLSLIYLLFITKLMQLPTDHKRPYLDELFFIVEIGKILK